MNTVLLKWVIAILAVLAVVFGYQIYEKNTGMTAYKPSEETSSTTKNVDPTVEEILNSPSKDGSESEKRAYAELVSGAAVETNKINISSCIAVPTVASFPDASDVILVNDDSVEHRVIFNVDTFFMVPAKSSKTIKANFGKGPGIYGFGCDNSRKAIGMVVVSPK